MTRTRTIGSALIGQGLDSLVFITLAFVGTIPDWRVGFGHCDAVVVFKSVYEAAVTPLTYVVVNFLKQQERIDICDHDTKFSPLLVRLNARKTQ